MKIRQLELFVAVAETSSFSRGAELVSLTQSTASQHIAALEAQVGTSLLDRTGKGVLLTSGGELFLHHARRVLAERDALQQAMAGFQGLQQARLTIGASNIPANYLIPPLLPQLQKRHPGISLTLLTGDSREILHRLEAAELELAVVGSRFELKTVDYFPLTSDLLQLVVAPGHRWGAQGSISLAELCTEPLIIRESGSGTGRTLETALRRVGLEPSELSIAARLGSNEAVLQAVACGVGGAFVSACSVRQALQRGELRKVDVPGLTVDRQIWLARLHGRTTSPAALAFCGLLRERFAGDSTP